MTFTRMYGAGVLMYIYRNVYFINIVSIHTDGSFAVIIIPLVHNSDKILIDQMSLLS